MGTVSVLKLLLLQAVIISSLSTGTSAQGVRELFVISSLSLGITAAQSGTPTEPEQNFSTEESVSDSLPSTTTSSCTCPTATMAPTATPQASLPANMPPTAATTTNYQDYAIFLGVTTGIFLVSTLVCSVLVLILCCQKSSANHRSSKGQPRERRESAFEGSPHWVDTATELDTAPEDNSKGGVTDLPMFSVNTFTAADYIAPVPGGQARPPSSSLSPSSYLDLNGTSVTTATTTTTATRAVGQTVCVQPPAPPTAPKGKAKRGIIPKRVAPPPPKGSKKGKKARDRAESVQYDLPVARGRWYSRKKKSTKSSNYEGLNLQQVQPPSMYSTPRQ